MRPISLAVSALTFAAAPSTAQVQVPAHVHPAPEAARGEIRLLSGYPIQCVFMRKSLTPGRC